LGASYRISGRNAVRDAQRICSKLIRNNNIKISKFIFDIE
jgi:hypothetical protein